MDCGEFLKDVESFIWLLFGVGVEMSFECVFYFFVLGFEVVIVFEIEVVGVLLVLVDGFGFRVLFVWVVLVINDF